MPHPNRIRPSTSKHCHKRTPLQRESDFHDIARLYLARRTQPEIAEWIKANRHYTLSRQQIGFDLQEIQKRWRTDCVRAIDDRKAEELARVDRLEREYWDAYERSKRDATRKAQEKSESNESGKDAHIRAKVEVEERDGDPRFLSGVMQCIEQRCKILGVNAPTRIANSDGGNIAPVSMTSVICYLPDNGRAIDSPNPIQRPT